MNYSVYKTMMVTVNSATDPVVQSGLVTASDTSEDWGKQRFYCSLHDITTDAGPAFAYSEPYKEVAVVLVVFALLYMFVVLFGIYYACKIYRNKVQKRQLENLEHCTDPKRNTGKAPKGMKNLGNTCYMNSLLQVLSWTPQIRQRLALHLMECLTLRKSQSFNGISVALRDIIEESHASESYQVDVKNLKAVLCEARKLNPQFKGNGQQDSFELFNTIIEGINDEFNVKLSGQSPASTGNDDDSGDSFTEDSPLSRLFVGIFLTVYKYQTCNHIETKFQRFTSISVPVQKQQNTLSPLSLRSTKHLPIKTSSSQSDASNELIRSKTPDIYCNNSNGRENMLVSSPETIFDSEIQGGLADHRSQIHATESVVVDISLEHEATYPSVANASSTIKIDSSVEQKSEAIYERQECDMDICDDETVDHNTSIEQRFSCTGEEHAHHSSMETEITVEIEKNFVDSQQLESDTTVKDQDMAVTHWTSEETVNALHKKEVQQMIIDSDSTLTPELDKQKDKNSSLPERQKRTDNTSAVSIPTDLSNHLKNSNMDRETNDCIVDKFSSTTFDTTQVKHEVTMPLSGCFETIKVPSSCQTELERGLQQLTGIEEYDEQELGCSNCKTGGNGTTQKKIMVISAPPVLVLQINKFYQEGKSLKKIDRHVTFPKDLSLDAFCSSAMQIEELGASFGSGEGVKYSLYGVVSHNGDLQSGHYTAYVRTNQNPSEFHDKFLSQKWRDPRKHQKLILDHLRKEIQRKKEQNQQNNEQNIETGVKRDMWFYISDITVRECEILEVLEDKNASLLFYERIG